MTRPRPIPAFQAELDGSADALCRPAEPALFRRAPDRASRRREDLFQARGAEPHRRAQDQQLLGQILLARRMGKTRIIAETGAGQHGVATATVVRALRPGLRRLHGRGRRRAAEAQRVPHEAAGRRGACRCSPAPRTLKDAMNEALRDWVTNVRRHLLLHRHGGGPASLSGDGARLPVGDRRRDARADAGARRAACPTRWSPASAAAPTPSACSIRSSTTATSDLSASRRPAMASTTELHAASHRPAAGPACCTATAPICCRTRTARSTRRHSISAGLDYPGIGPEHAWLHEIGRVKYRLRHRRRGAGGLPALSRARRHHPGAGVGPRARPRRSKIAPRSGRRTS